MADILEVLRTEKKYPLSTFEAEQLKSRLYRILPLDDHCRDAKGYTVISLYFDSAVNVDFWEKDAGLENRKKIRLRCYGGSPGSDAGGQSSIYKLEWKQKQGSKQRKLSLLLSEEEAAAMIRGDYSCLLSRRGKSEEELAMQFYTLMTSQLYRPRCVVKYDRLAYVVPANDIRITLDSHLSYNESNFNILDPNLSTFPVSPVNRTTLEVKYNHFLLSYVKQAISINQLTEIASSKYCACRPHSIGGRMV